MCKECLKKLNRFVTDVWCQQITLCEDCEEEASKLVNAFDIVKYLKEKGEYTGGEKWN